MGRVWGLSGLDRRIDLHRVLRFAHLLPRIGAVQLRQQGAQSCRQIRVAFGVQLLRRYLRCWYVFSD